MKLLVHRVNVNGMTTKKRDEHMEECKKKLENYDLGKDVKIIVIPYDSSIEVIEV